MSTLTNLPDLLGLHFGNPLGLTPLVMLIVVCVVVGIMTYFNHQIRYRDGGRFYPVLYTLFGVSLLAVFYYVFQADLPKIGETACIGWHCRSSLVGGVAWAIVGIALTTLVSFGLFIATMQIVAQLSVEAGMSLEEKRWKEWKWGLAIVLLGVSVTGISFEINQTVGSWALIVTALLTVAFVIFKIVRDTIYCGNFLWTLLIGLVFLLGTAASMTLFLEVIHACVYLTVILVAFLARSKARKKKTAKK
ncbi:MAG: hypothetical protein K6F85_02585 [Bacteroidales bacterium]|nr:hypothetical protein [Bacteroidales bacterium]